MARIRSIKPEFWTSAQIMECSTNARLMFIGMWNFADDCGRLPLSPKTIKAQIFPSDDITSETILGMICELSTNGLLLKYVVEEKEYLQITGWQHQRIDKPQPAKYPAPVNGFSKIIPRTVATDLKGSEGIGEDRIGKSRAVALDDWPEDFGDVFWQAYPRKTEKLAAMKKLSGLRKSRIVTFADLMAGVKRYAAANIDPKFTKHPTTWLNAGCWADETHPGENNGNRAGSVHPNSGAFQSTSTAILAGVAAATERRSRERSAAGQHRQEPQDVDFAREPDPQLFGTG